MPVSPLLLISDPINDNSPLSFQREPFLDFLELIISTFALDGQFFIRSQAIIFSPEAVFHYCCRPPLLRSLMTYACKSFRPLVSWRVKYTLLTIRNDYTVYKSMALPPSPPPLTSSTPTTVSGIHSSNNISKGSSSPHVLNNTILFPYSTSGLYLGTLCTNGGNQTSVGWGATWK